jgi:hypothetical protein
MTEQELRHAETVRTQRRIDVWGVLIVTFLAGVSWAGVFS